MKSRPACRRPDQRHARVGGRSVWDIVRTNVFTCSTSYSASFSWQMITFGSWRTHCSGHHLANAIIGITQKMRAKVALDRFTVLTAPAAKVVRDGKEREIPVAEVCSTTAQHHAGDQIVTDGETLEIPQPRGR